MHDNAVRLLEEAVEIRKRVLGPEHANCLTSMGNLANAYFGKGEYARAAASGEEILACRRRALGEEQPPGTLMSMKITLVYMNILARFYLSLRD